MTVRSFIEAEKPDPQDWRLLPKEHPLPAAYLAGLAAITAGGVVLPYAEELRRRLRAAVGEGSRR
ncbi:hypothetical protein ACGFZQ_44265 [Streptomyces sp. NPDC048254]|uniref:hypothetical protein n=1 Tax=Streptomyces sp. NPDC048254 TaxID=3365525 RepID=UPI00371F52B8